MTFFVMAVVTAIPLFWAMWVAIRTLSPCMLFSSLTFFAYFVFFPVLTISSDPALSLEAGAFLKPQVLAFLWILLLFGSAHLWRRHIVLGRTEDRSVPVRPFNDRQLLMGGLALSLTGFLASVAFSILTMRNAWSRETGEEFSGMGFLSLLGDNLSVFPIVVFFVYRFGRRPMLLVTTTAVVMLLWLCYSYAFSGVTGGPIAALLPIGVLFSMGRTRFSVKRLAIVAVLIYAAVSGLRFMRQWGSLSEGGRYSVDLDQVVQSYSNSALRPSQSFNEFFWFAKAVSYVDAGGERLGTTPYAYCLIQFVPSAFFPDKIWWNSNGRTDYFMRDVVLKKVYGGLIPVGSYGEAYLSGGIVTLVAVPILIGLVMAYIDSRIDRTILRVPGRLAGSLLCVAFIIIARGSLHYTFIVFAGFAVLSLIFRVTEVVVPGEEGLAPKGAAHSL